MDKPKAKYYLSIGLIFLGVILIIKGIFDLGYHYGLEEIRKSDSGLGGFAEWAAAMIETFIGLLLALAGMSMNRKIKLPKWDELF